MALKRNLAKAGKLLEDMRGEFYQPGEFVSKPDFRDSKEAIKDSQLQNPG
jgi:hypothetical protein